MSMEDGTATKSSLSPRGSQIAKTKNYETGNDGYWTPMFYLVPQGGEVALLLTIDKVAEYLGLKKSALYD